jgi:hypothetical protein
MNSLSINFASESSEVIHDKGFFSRIDDIVAAGSTYQYKTSQGKQTTVFAGHVSIYYFNSDRGLSYIGLLLQN